MRFINSLTNCNIFIVNWKELYFVKETSQALIRLNYTSIYKKNQNVLTSFIQLASRETKHQYISFDILRQHSKHSILYHNYE